MCRTEWAKLGKNSVMPLGAKFVTNKNIFEKAQRAPCKGKCKQKAQPRLLLPWRYRQTFALARLALTIAWLQSFKCQNLSMERLKWKLFFLLSYWRTKKQGRELVRTRGNTEPGESSVSTIWNCLRRSRTQLKSFEILIYFSREDRLDTVFKQTRTAKAAHWSIPPIVEKQNFRSS